MPLRDEFLGCQTNKSIQGKQPNDMFSSPPRHSFYFLSIKFTVKSRESLHKIFDFQLVLSDGVI